MAKEIMTIYKEDWENLLSRLSALEAKMQDNDDKCDDTCDTCENCSSGVFSEAFKEHLKIFFDAVQDKDCLTVAEAYKCEDCPYEAKSNNSIWDLKYWNEEEYAAIKKALGDEAGEEWIKKFEDFVESEGDCFDERDANDYYPGEVHYLVITDNLEYDEIEDTF